MRKVFILVAVLALQSKVLSYFFISADTLEKYGYDYVASHNLILARYDLTESDMRFLDMVIPYPPTESMKEMKIWIPERIAVTGDTLANIHVGDG